MGYTCVGDNVNLNHFIIIGAPRIVNNAIITTLNLVDAGIFYTKYALENVKELVDNAILAGISFRAPTLGFAGHGIDTSDFFPILGMDKNNSNKKSRLEARKLLFSESPILHNSFIVLNANRAYYRKRLDISITGFALFAKNYPDAYLYLHTSTTSEKEKLYLEDLIEKSGVKNQVLFNILNIGGEKLPVSKLNLLYNACDVGLTTAMGEGWGLTCFEHAATGVPQIMPNHTSFIENWMGSSIMLPPIKKEYVFYEMADMFVVAPEDVVKELRLLYNDPNYCLKMAKAAYIQSKEPKFNWSSIKEKFLTILEELN